MEKYFEEYENYLIEHVKNVKRAFYLLFPFIENKLNFSKQELETLKGNILSHDKSKWKEDEFIPYAKHFFGKRGKGESENFKEAERKHKNRNPHHIEFWKERNEEMPAIYTVEMVCDWWAFSFQKNDPNEIFDWHNKNKIKLKLNENNEKIVDKLLEEIKRICKTIMV